ncbi:MAG: polymer-forming cytoskeletal protein, partial [Pararhodobacter sp.]
MFSKSRINETAGRPDASRQTDSSASAPVSSPVPRPSVDFGGASGAAKPKPAASVLSADLQISGNLRTSGDVVIEGVVDGDIRAHLLTVGESATIRGEIVADDIVINGRVIGRVRGLKVRLTSTARVEGDIIHKTIAIESGAHFEGSVQRQDDPLAGASTASAHQPAQSAAPRPAAAAPQPAPQQRPAP